MLAGLPALAIAFSPVPHAVRRADLARSSPVLTLNLAPAELPQDAVPTLPRASATSYFQPLQEGDVLQSTQEHRRVCAAAALTVAAMLIKLPLLVSWPLTLPRALGLGAAFVTLCVANEKRRRVWSWI